MFRVAALYGAVSWLLLQVGDVIVEPLGLPAWTMKLLIVLIALGFVVSMLVAWTYELTPEGLVRDTGELPGGKRALSAGRKLDFAVIAVLCAALAYFVVNRSQAPDGAQTRASGEPTTLAVLPFVSLSSDPEDGYFADGLSEELLNLLADVDGLKVPGRTSSFYFKDRKEEPREIGRKLGVAHILEGSVRRSGPKLRITAQLINAADGFHLWSETYDREMTDVFAIQDEIGQAVAQALKLELLGKAAAPDTARRKVDPQAYQYALVARAKLRERGLENLRSAVQLFDRAIEKDRNYAEAYAGKAGALMLLFGNHGEGDPQQVFGEAGRAARRALELDPLSSEANVAAGMHARMQADFGSGGDRAAARMYLEKAHALDPDNTTAAYWLGRIEERRNPRRALELMNRVIELDPLELMAAVSKAQILSLLGDGDAARAEFERLRGLYPDSTALLGNFINNEVEWGRLDHALELAEDPNYLRSDLWKHFVIGQVEVGLGNLDAARAHFAMLKGTPLLDWTRASMVAAMNRDYARVFAVDREAAATNPVGRQALLFSAMLTHQSQFALQLAREDMPGLFADPVVVPENRHCSAAYVALALRHSGDSDAARALAEAVLTQWDTVAARNDPSTLACRSGVSAMAGRTDEAIAEFTRAVDLGFRGVGLGLPIPMADDPMMRELSADPRMQEQLRRISEDLERQRIAVAARRAAMAPAPATKKAASS